MFWLVLHWTGKEKPFGFKLKAPYRSNGKIEHGSSIGMTVTLVKLEWTEFCNGKV